MTPSEPTGWHPYQQEVGLMRVVTAITLALCAGVVVALAGASSARATTYGTHTYCNDCNLGSVPAVGPSDHYTSNHSSTFYLKKQQIYYYGNGGVTECGAASTTGAFGLNSLCETVFAKTTARCHLLNDGTSPAYCWADWRCDTCVITRPLFGPANAGELLGVEPVADSIGALDTGTAAWLEEEDLAEESPTIGSHLLASASKLGALPDGRIIYEVPTSMNRLCVVLAMTAESCANPLSKSAPISFTVVDRDGPGGAAPVAYGAALAGVKAVSFDVAGTHEVVPVSSNMFTFAGPAAATTADFSVPTVTFDDGTTAVAH
jgi:hypothetical protein